jgi:alpha/beta superfamily hydrolase
VVIERAVTIGFGGGLDALEGLYLPGAGGEPMGGAVVGAPHPLMGGSMDSPVVSEISFACSKAGLASLRFNWRGVGASAGAPSDAASDADEDYSAAVVYLAETVEGPLVAAGYSFGAAAALRAAARHPRIRRLVLVAPPAARRERTALAGAGRKLLLVTGRRDAWAAPAELEQRIAGLPHATLHVVPDADHFFVEGLADVGRAVAGWL